MTTINPVNSTPDANRLFEVMFGNLDETNKTGKTNNTNSNTLPPAGDKNTSGETPLLPQPGTQLTPETLGGLDSTLGSLAAQLNLLITKTATEQRKNNREDLVAATNAAVKQIEKQADQMQKKAMLIGMMGLLAGSLQIAGGFASLAALGNGLKGAGDMNSKIMAATTKAGAWQSMLGGASSIVQSASQAGQAEFDAEIKKLEASQTNYQSIAERIKSYTDSLSELISKTNQTVSSLVENSNQSLNRILG
ncbi:MAG: hypothetical protein IJ228_10695 [Succinivibrio sp.]|nr:hypothetical protein [Succinivibrio sp.]